MPINGMAKGWNSGSVHLCNSLLRGALRIPHAKALNPEYPLGIELELSFGASTTYPSLYEKCNTISVI